MNLTDAHCHYHDEWLLAHRQPVFAELTAVGVRSAVVNGTSETDWLEVASFCEQASRPAFGRAAVMTTIPSFGVHPWHAGNRSPDWQQTLTRFLDRTPGSAIGEIGLDRWMLDRARPDDPRLAGLRRAPLDEQIEVFRWQLALAAGRNLPASIHCVDAWGALLETLRTGPRPARGFLLHAYAGSAELIPAFAELGACFSFNGYFLDPRRERRLRPVFARIPIDRLLVESDAPAMSLPSSMVSHVLPPAPDGSTVNHPANIAVAYAGLAAWREIPVADLVVAVERNFQRLFGAR